MNPENSHPNGNMLFQTGQEVRILICHGMEMAVPETCVAAVKELDRRQSEKYRKQGSVRVKDFGSFWSGLTGQFTGTLSHYSNSLLRKMVLPVMVPKGLGLPEMPDDRSRFMAVLSFNNWHGVVLCSFAHDQPILLGNFDSVHNGDVAGKIERTNLNAILLIDVVSLLKREGFLTVAD